MQFSSSDIKTWSRGRENPYCAFSVNRPGQLCGLWSLIRWKRRGRVGWLVYTSVESWRRHFLRKERLMMVSQGGGITRHVWPPVLVAENSSLLWGPLGQQMVLSVSWGPTTFTFISQTEIFVEPIKWSLWKLYDDGGGSNMQNIINYFKITRNTKSTPAWRKETWEFGVTYEIWIYGNRTNWNFKAYVLFPCDQSYTERWK